MILLLPQMQFALHACWSVCAILVWLYAADVVWLLLGVPPAAGLFILSDFYAVCDVTGD